MATYNGAKYIGEQIDSILAQTFKDYELVICDDCSTDGTWDILKEYAEKYTYVRIFRNDKNLGYVKNFEKVISLCKGEYIALSDQDDIWLPNHIEVLKDAMTNDCQIVCGRAIFVDENNNELPMKEDYLFMYNPPLGNERIARHILLANNSYQGASMLIKRTFFEKALPIPDGAKYHDSWFAILACFTGGLAYLDKPVIRYRRCSNSVTIKANHTSPFRRFFRYSIHNYSARDRLIFIKSIRERVMRLSKEQVKLLGVTEKMLRRRNTFLGRITNLPYQLRFFKDIYTTDFLHLFS